MAKYDRRCNRIRLPRTRKEAQSYRNCGFFTSLFALVFIIVAIVAPILLREQLLKELRDATIIDSNTSLGWEVWSDNSEFPIRTEVYVMDIVNPYELMRGARPVVHERGPYVYKYFKKVFNYTWNRERTQCIYRTHEHYQFDARASNGLLETDNFTSVNVVFQAMRAMFGGTHESRAVLPLIYDQFVPMPMEDRLLQTYTVHELIFGYRDPVLEFASTIDPSIQPFYPGLIGNSTWEKSNAEAPEQVIRTGRGDSRKVRQLVSIDGSEYWKVCPTAPCPPNPAHPIWATEAASMIDGGSDGSQFKPQLRKSDVLKYWDGTAYRAVNLYFERETLLEGISCYRFQTNPKETMGSRLSYPTNADYYHFETTDGVFNLSSAALGAPLIGTRPHFDGVGSEVKDTVIGAWPTDVDTSSYFELEPISGASMKIVGQTQLAMQLSPLRGVPVDNTTVDWFPEIRVSYPPLAYFKQSVQISAKDAKEFVRVVYGAQSLIDLCLYLCSTLGGLLGLWALWMVWWGRRQLLVLPSKITETSRLFDDDGRSPRLDSTDTAPPLRSRQMPEDIDLTYSDDLQVSNPGDA